MLDDFGGLYLVIKPQYLSLKSLNSYKDSNCIVKL